jgi:CubicO group peptidase (beta-lactamase class C family)
MAHAAGMLKFHHVCTERGTIVMNIHRPVPVILLSLLAASCGRPPYVAAQAEPSGVALHLDSTAAVFERGAAAGFAGAVVIRSGGREVFSAAAGKAGPEIPFTEHTAIDIASIAKPVTAMAILKLAEQGRLGLDDPIERWFPEAPSDKRRITLRQLLSHSSGITSFVDGVGDYTSSAADLALLTGAFMQGRIVGQGLVKEALTPVIASPRTNAQLGLGWMLYQIRLGLQAYHNGGSRHSSTEVVYYADLGVTVVSVANSGRGAGTEMGRLITEATLPRR